ncbi:hypothetical protein ABTL77_20505, partial [Acinetobacter baumannii]
VQMYQFAQIETVAQIPLEIIALITVIKDKVGTESSEVKAQLEDNIAHMYFFQSGHAHIPVAINAYLQCAQRDPKNPDWAA